MNDEISTIDRRSAAAMRAGDPDDAPAAVLRFAGFEFDPRRDELRRDGVPVPLRPKPRALLRHLLAHPGRLLGKDELIAALWGGVVVTDDSLVQCVGELRAALGDRGQHLIKTLPRRGYLFDAQVEQGAAVPVTPQPSNAPASRRRAVRSLVPLLALLLAAGALVWQWRAQAPAGHPGLDQALAARRAVAVLPLADPDAKGGVSPFTENLSDAITGAMAQRTRMGSKVMGRAVTAGYDAARPDIARIGRELMARYVVSGQVQRRDDGQVIVTTQATVVQSGDVLLLDRSAYASERAALQSNHGRRVASAMRMRVAEASRVIASEPDRNLDPVELLVAGWSDVNLFITREDLLRGRRRLEAAARFDPLSTMAAQGIGVAHALELGNLWSESPAQQLESAERAIRRSLELAPNLQENRAIWGELLILRGDGAAAIDAMTQLLSMSPHYATGHTELARALINQGRVEEALPHIEEASNLSAADVRLMRYIYGTSANAALVQGADAEAYRWAGREAAEFPSSPWPFALLAALDALAGRDADAAAHIARHRELAPNSTIAYVRLLNKSDNARYRAAIDRLIQGLRKAGLPER